MSVHKSDAFISDVEGQYEWYAIHADGDIAERYLQAIEATCGLLEHHPLIGPRTGFSHPRLVHWRFMVVFRPFNTSFFMKARVAKCFYDGPCMATGIYPRG